jgi:hypothetical protein
MKFFKQVLESLIVALVASRYARAGNIELARKIIMS